MKDRAHNYDMSKQWSPTNWYQYFLDTIAVDVACELETDDDNR
jgi:hypothetical protein